MIFIGPTAAQLEAVGDKLRARAEAQRGRRAGRAGRRGRFAAGRTRLARAIGLPLLVKAVGGGGGRGMKLVER